MLQYCSFCFWSRQAGAVNSGDKQRSMWKGTGPNSAAKILSDAVWKSAAGHCTLLASSVVLITHFEISVVAGGYGQIFPSVRYLWYSYLQLKSCRLSSDATLLLLLVYQSIQSTIFKWISLSGSWIQHSCSYQFQYYIFTNAVINTIVISAYSSLMYIKIYDTYV